MHGAAFTPYPVKTNFKFCSWNSHDHRYHQMSFSRARDRTGRNPKKRKGRNDQKRMILDVLKWKTHAVCHSHKSAWCVRHGISDGYLILLFCPNCKIPQNIVPTNRNKKVRWTFRYQKLLPFCVTHSVVCEIVYSFEGALQKVLGKMKACVGRT